MDRIDEIRARVEKASRGPWELYCAELRRGLGVEVIEVLSHGKPIIKWPGFDGVDLSGEKKRHNADFMAHAREDIPYLLTALAEKDKRIEELEAPNLFNDAGCQYKCHVVDRYKAALEEIASVPCICEPCYKDRGLIQPDCFYCHVGIIATDALKEGGENE